MSNNYSRQYKSSRFYKEKESVKSKTKYASHKHHQLESKTPPLPTKTNSSLEELIRKRESLKEELKKIVKHPDNETNTIRKHAHSKEDNEIERKLKRQLTVNDKKAGNIKKIKFTHESSPELEHTQMESEDEETIIQQRRQQRKQLLAKLNDSNNQSGQYEHSFTKKRTEIHHSHGTQNPKISKQVTDMFSEKDEFESKTSIDHVTQDSNDTNLTDNWDNPEGYYNVRVGDILNNKYTIKGILGQGVFSNVVRAQDIYDGNNNVAIKIVRNNHLMYKTSLKEIATLKEIQNADPDGKYHCVNFLDHFIHRGHLCLLLESLHMDLRAVIKKYGKHSGLNMKALMSYSRQLFLALRLLKRLGIIHADIKPDNILINEKKNVLKLCDFGSALKLDDNEPTPYLVSRFYRAPEIILGVPYTHGVDIWSTACTIYEMATGKILFTGNSNNKMLKCFMDLKGKFSKRFVKKGKFRDQHFNYNNNFLLHNKDEFTGREKVVELCNITTSRDLMHELKKAYKNLCEHEMRKIVQIKDLLDKMTMLDPSQRINVVDCLKHHFISEEMQCI